MRDRSAILETRASLKSCAVVAKYLAKKGRPARTKSDLAAAALDVLAGILVAASEVESIESIEDAITTLRSFNLLFSTPEQRRAIARALQIESAQAEGRRGLLQGNEKKILDAVLATQLSMEEEGDL